MIGIGRSYCYYYITAYYLCKPEIFGFVLVKMKFWFTRCGVRTHDPIREPDLKSGALTARPTWLVFYTKF